MNSTIFDEPIQHEDAKDTEFHEEETAFDCSSRSFVLSFPLLLSSWLSRFLLWIER